MRASENHSASKAHGEVALFFTGGTILMCPGSQDRGVVPSSEFGRFLAELKHHAQGVGLRPVHWADLPSPHMTPQLMFQLAQDVNNTLEDPSVIGAVILHGTDVLVESAYMADLIIGSPKPVVYTGSMRFYSEVGYDGIRNLLNGIKICLLALPPRTGVVLLMADRIFTAHDVAKINSLNIDAFEAPDAGPIGYVAGDNVIFTRPTLIQAAKTKRAILKPKTLEPNVPLITCYTGMDGDLIEHLSEQGIAGLVVEGFGAGNVPPAVVPSLEALPKKNIPVVLTTRCPEGGVWPIYAYPGGGVDLQRKGIILGRRLSGPKARIKLMVALGLTRNMEEINRIFEQDIRPLDASHLPH